MNPNMGKAKGLLEGQELMTHQPLPHSRLLKKDISMSLKKTLSSDLLIVLLSLFWSTGNRALLGKVEML